MFQKIKGFRTIILVWLIHVLTYFDNFLNIAIQNGSQHSKAVILSTAYMAILVTLKQIITDAIPRINELRSGNKPT